MNSEETRETEREQSIWRIVKHKQRFTHAFRGLRVFSATTPHLVIHLSAAVAVILLGFYLQISNLEFIILLFCIGLVIISEAFNTAIEIDINLTSPEYHPYARDTKDVAAAAVLLAVFFSVIVGCIIFLPKIF